MIPAALNHLWQSTVILAAIAGLSVLFRRHRAHVRYALWLSASLKFCLPLAVFVSVGGAFATVPDVPVAPATPHAIAASLSINLDALAEPFDVDGAVAAAPARTPPVDWAAWGMAAWIAGVAAIGGVRLREWLRVRAIVRASTALAIDGIVMPPGVALRSTASPIGPCIVGWWRPVMLLPAGLEELPRPQLDAVVAHELCHVRRRDTLAAAAHMVVETIFWFHPLVWWIGSRLVVERERACDEHVLAQGIDPFEYSAAIVSVCRRFVDGPLAHVPGVTGSDLRARVDAILAGRIGLRITSAQRFALAAAAVSTLLLPIAVGTLTAPLRAAAGGPQAGVSRQAFDVASIKPCVPETMQRRASSGTGGGVAQSGGPDDPSASPGRLYLPCRDVRSLINLAYVVSRSSELDPRDPLNNWPDGVGARLPDGSPTLVRGGPAWLYTEKYTIEAKAPGVPDAANSARERLAMTGPMLRSLLESRFALALHQEREQASMLALVVAKGGLKIKPIASGGCVTDRSNGPVILSDAVRLGVKPTCNTVSAGFHDGNWRYEHGGQTLRVLAAILSGELGTPVLDRTGVSDLFNITLEFAPDESSPRAARMLERFGPQPPIPPTAPSIYRALDEQLGLAVKPVKEERAFFVVDHVERPTPDVPQPAPASGKHAGQ